MITLYGRGGSGGFEIVSSELEKEERENILYNASRLLSSRGFPSAAGLLRRFPFDILNASNDFNDEFCVLFAILSLNEYEEIRKIGEEGEGKTAFHAISKAIEEIGPYIRYIACELAMEQPGTEWKTRIINSGTTDLSHFRNSGLPVAVCAVVNETLSGSHDRLNTLFRDAGAPGDPPQLSHLTKWKEWLLRASRDPTVDAHSVLGKILEEFMEVEPADDQVGSISWSGKDFLSAKALWLAKKERVESVLQKYGLRYVRSGRIVDTGVGPAAEDLAQALKQHDFDTLDVEFRRALDTVAHDPGVAITASCALLEALFKAYLEEKGIEFPSKETIKPLWSSVQKELGLDPKDQKDADIQRILGGMTSIVDGIGALRTHAGSAHGGGRLRYRVQSRHAKLVINSAHSLALFLIETWIQQRA